MEKQKKSHVRREFTIHHTGFPAYKKIMAVFEAEEKENRLITTHPIKNKQR